MKADLGLLHTKGDLYYSNIFIQGKESKSGSRVG